MSFVIHLDRRSIQQTEPSAPIGDTNACETVRWPTSKTRECQPTPLLLSVLLARSGSNVVASFHSRCSVRDFLLKDGAFLYASNSISYTFAGFDTYWRAAFSVGSSTYVFVLQVLRCVISNQLNQVRSSFGPIMLAIMTGRLDPHRDAASVTILR